MRVLLVEDERNLSAAICKLLEKERMTVDPVYTGTDGLDWALSSEYDAIILDVMLPGMDGFSVLRELRKEKISTPVLMLTARASLEDRLTGLDSGADYYLPKPFESAELVSCLHAITRRGNRTPIMSLSYGDICLEQKDAKLRNTESGAEIKLGAKEYQLMELFLRNPAQILTKETMQDKVWGLESDAEYNNLEVYVSFLRKKLSFIGSRMKIRATRGLGYSLEEETVSVGIVLAIHLSTQRNIAAQAETSLAALAEKNGNPGRGEMSKPDDDGKKPDDDGKKKHESEKSWPKDIGQPPEIRNGRDAAAAELGNSYSISLNEDGTVASWSSERTDLYSDGQIAEMAEAVLAEGKESGRIGTQFYRKTNKNNETKVLVLDARLDYLSAESTLRSVILVTAAACVLLSLLAWLLIRRMVRPVEEAFVRQKQFVSDASHELKTPLAVISANAEVLEQEIGQNEYLGYIRSEVRRTDSLVRNLLTLARMDRQEKGIEMKPFDLSHALLDVVLPFESTVYETGKILEYDIPDGIECNGNEEMIKQLAVILLSNALKYSDEGGQIRISLNARGKQREIRVFNTGNPIAPEDQEKIFDRFWRADPAHGSETGGHGLGLAIARSIVDTHHGKISVESKEGKGTTFTVTLNA